LIPVHACGVDTIISGLYDARISVFAGKIGPHIHASANPIPEAKDGYIGNQYLIAHIAFDNIQGIR
jgi:hypothetical protein